MAKKKKASKGRRRRVGALSPSSPLIKIGAVAAGYFLAATPVNGMIDKVTAGKIDNKIVGAGQVGIGALLLLSKRPNIIKTVAGGIAAGTGLKRVMTAFGTPAPAPAPAVTGYGRVPVVGGYRSVPVIGNRMGAYSPSGTLGGYAIPSGRMGKVMGSVDGSTLIGN